MTNEEKIKAAAEDLAQFMRTCGLLHATPEVVAEILERHFGESAPEQKEGPAMTNDANGYRSEADRQLGRLAKFIQQEVAGEPSRSEGAVDTAIRIIRELTAAPQKLLIQYARCIALCRCGKDALNEIHAGGPAGGDADVHPYVPDYVSEQRDVRARPIKARRYLYERIGRLEALLQRVRGVIRTDSGLSTDITEELSKGEINK